jgi:hypothetical protein
VVCCHDSTLPVDCSYYNMYTSDYNSRSIIPIAAAARWALCKKGAQPQLYKSVDKTFVSKKNPANHRVSQFGLNNYSLFRELTKNNRTFM